MNTRFPETVPTAYRAPAGVEGVANRQIDELVVKSYPVVAGGGVPVFTRA